MDKNIKYKVVPNATPTKDVAPYLGIAVPNGSLAYDNILTRMVANGTHMTEPTARYFLEAFYELAAEVISAECVRISTGTVAIFPNISGGFDSEDADFDPERNKLFIDAAITQSLQDRVSGLVPVSAGTADGNTSVKISSAYDPVTKLFNAISGTDDVNFAGVNLTVPDAEDESFGLWKADLSEKVGDFEVVSTDGGQRITAHLSNAVAIPKGKYKVRLASHGLDPTAKLAVVTLSVTLVEAVEAPAAEPTFTKVVDADHIDESQWNTPEEWNNLVTRNGRACVVGTNLTSDLVVEATVNGEARTFTPSEVTSEHIVGQIGGEFEFGATMVVTLKKADGTVIGSANVSICEA